MMDQKETDFFSFLQQDADGRGYYSVNGETMEHILFENTMDDVFGINSYSMDPLDMPNDCGPQYKDRVTVMHTPLIYPSPSPVISQMYKNSLSGSSRSLTQSLTELQVRSAGNTPVLHPVRDYNDGIFGDVSGGCLGFDDPMSLSFPPLTQPKLHDQRLPQHVVSYSNTSRPIEFAPAIAEINYPFTESNQFNQSTEKKKRGRPPKKPLSMGDGASVSNAHNINNSAPTFETEYISPKLPLSASTTASLDGKGNSKKEMKKIERKTLHNQLERKRRIELNANYDRLANLVHQLYPDIIPEVVTKATVLSIAIDCIERMKEERDRNKVVNQ